ncbi:hypothetical protein CMI42_00865 [Candidatus Pacearchaeota archaeon]|nr:hypothetical protein [Candidatus Pacearchaeota archaeon]
MFTKELLIEEYKLNKRSPQQIIKEYGGSETTIYRDMKKYGIKRRSSSENQLSENFKEPTKEELIRLHDKEHKSKNEIAKIFNVSWGAIDRRFKKFDLKGKSISEIRLPKSFIEPSEQELKELINKKN